jgi:hypothetical protein
MSFAAGTRLGPYEVLPRSNTPGETWRRPTRCSTDPSNRCVGSRRPPCDLLVAGQPNLDRIRHDPGFVAFLVKQKEQWEAFKRL